MRHILLVVFLGCCKQAIGQDVSQDDQNKPALTFYPDKSLISIKKYNIAQSDSVLSTQWAYSAGKLINIQNGPNNTTFEYPDKYFVNAICGKIRTAYLFDQYGALYYQRTIVDSTGNLNQPSRCPTYEFRSYVYQDSMKLFCNIIMSQSIWTEYLSEKYEYDEKKRLIKVLHRYSTRESDHYVTAKELFYNADGLLIKAVEKLGGSSDSTIFQYNSRKQLIKENSYTAIDTTYLQYYYTANGLLRMVTEISNWDSGNRYVAHYYFEY